MKQGHRIPPEIRDDWARFAWLIKKRGGKLVEIEAAFNISTSTARNLVARGRALEMSDDIATACGLPK